MNRRHLAGLPLGLALALALSATACLAPPAVQPSIYVYPDLALELYPRGTRRVELTLTSGERLRGYFVPAEEGAPVVLHLLESAGSAATLKMHYGVVCKRLQGLGLASLIVDYRGIGASEGSRSSKHLAEDARVMWAAAVQFAGGDPGRVILRGISLGTVAVAGLLEEGAEPGAVIVHAPVFGDSATQRFAARRYGAFLGGLGSFFFSDLSDADLPEALEHFTGPVLVTAGSRDLFLSDADRKRLAEAVPNSPVGGAPLKTSHLGQTVLAHELELAELVLLTALFPCTPLSEDELEHLLAAVEEDPRGGAAARERMDVPEVRARIAVLGGQARNAKHLLVATLALRNEASTDTLRYLWMLDEEGLPAGLSFDELVDATSLQDSTGVLSLDLILAMSKIRDLEVRFGGFSMKINDQFVVALVGGELGRTRSAVSITLSIDWDEAKFTAAPRTRIRSLLELGFEPEVVRRAVARELLKGARIPERTYVAEDGSAHLEVFDKDGWKELELQTVGPLPIPLPMKGTELGARATAILEAHRGEVAEPQVSAFKPTVGP